MQEKLENKIFIEIDHIIVPLSPLEIVRQFIPKINPENVPHISHEIFHHIFCEIPPPTVYSIGFYMDIWNHYQVQQYKSYSKSFLYNFGSFEVP